MNWTNCQLNEDMERTIERSLRLNAQNELIEIYYRNERQSQRARRLPHEAESERVAMESTLGNAVLRSSASPQDFMKIGEFETLLHRFTMERNEGFSTEYRDRI
jgi:hypothetical protein